MIALGKPAGLAVSKVKITKAQKDHARSWRAGKGKLIMGVCYGESGKYVFQFEDKPPAGLAKLIKKAVKNQAKKEIKLKVRGGGVDIDDETDLDEMGDLGEDAPEADAPGEATTDGDGATTAEPKKAADPAADRVHGLDSGA